MKTLDVLMEGFAEQWVRVPCAFNPAREIALKRPHVLMADVYQIPAPATLALVHVRELPPIALRLKLDVPNVDPQ